MLYCLINRAQILNDKKKYCGFNIKPFLNITLKTEHLASFQGLLNSQERSLINSSYLHLSVGYFFFLLFLKFDESNLSIPVPEAAEQLQLITKIQKSTNMTYLRQSSSSEAIML